MKSLVLIPLAVLVAALIGCQPSSPAKSKPSVRVSADGQENSISPSQGVFDQSDVMAGKEPCAARLHDIAGDMLLYYAIHKRLPEKLDELRETADFDQELNFTCPETGRPYVYVPDGLVISGRDERLVMHDDAPVHHGARYGVVAVERKGDRPPSMWAVRLPEEIFNLYRPALKMAAPTSRPSH